MNKVKRITILMVLSLGMVACQTNVGLNQTLITPKSQYELNASLEDAKTAYHDGRLVEAEKLYLNILASHPEVSDAWFKLGNIYYRSGRYNAAVNAYESVLRVDNQNDRAWYNLALARLSQSIEVIDAGMTVMDPSSEFYQRSALLKKSLVSRVGNSLKGNTNAVPKVEKTSPLLPK